VFYVCGADHALYCSGGFGGGRLGLVVIPRSGEGCGKNYPDKNVFWASAVCALPCQWPSQAKIESFSSTKIRQALDKNDIVGAATMMGEAVTAYVQTHRLYGAGSQSETKVQVPLCATMCAPVPESFSSSVDTQPSVDTTVAAADASCSKLLCSTRPPKVYVFISATALARQWTKIPQDVMKSALFFFGSKQKWLFPTTPEEKAEAMAQPGEYALMAPAFKSIIRAKLDRGEVFFLKSPDLDYKRYPGPPDPGAYVRASLWLTNLGYAPLNLDPAWWREHHPKDAERIVHNFQGGFHEYAEVQALVSRSNANLEPVYNWR